MNAIFDSSCLINLEAGEAFHLIHNVGLSKIHIGPQVLDECISIRNTLDAEISKGKINLLDDGILSFEEYETTRKSFGLGPGETECLLFCKKLGISVACDDKKARKIIKRTVGAEKVFGTIWILEKSVSLGQISIEYADNSLSKMRSSGSFLPNHNFDVAKVKKKSANN